MNNKRHLSPIRMPIQSDKIINYSMLFLVVFGLIMVASASMGIAVGDSTYLIRTVVKQLIFSIGGYIVMVLIC